MNIRLQLAMGIVVIVTLGLQVQARDCSDVQSVPNTKLGKWVITNRKSADPQCLTEAIRRLGEVRSPETAIILVSLLDFQRPEAEAERMQVSSMRDQYPAVPALFSLGQQAVPSLLNAVGSGALKPVARKNAVRALLYVHRENPADAVKALHTESTKSQDKDRIERLNQAAKEVADLCPNESKNKCIRALQEQQ